MRIQFVVAACILSFSTEGQIVQAIRPDGNLDTLINEPFSADVTTTLVRTLSDGTHIARQTSTAKMYRDSEGRTRTDRIPGKFFAGQPAPPPTIYISDPIAGYSYTLETATKIAHRTAIQRPHPGQPMVPPNNPTTVPTPTPNNSQPQFKTEDLGTQTMEGLIVQGRRTTVTTPAGAIGNDRDIVNVSEIWSNKELRLMILQIHSDPRSGETTTKIENLSRTQPDPGLFQSPPDYKIVDATKSQ